MNNSPLLSGSSAIQTLIAMAIVLSQFGCGVVADMSETQKKADEASSRLEKQLGVKPVIGWNIHNGTLTNVNVIFPATKVAQRTVAELESQTKAAIAEVFKESPKQLVVSFTSGQ